ncbi:hypothetical protein [Streptomyces sp. NPDC048603]|uniref:hypothetical protein n=1 Tax=Streptomyces sp. NPDC048603 TaxID=3365577 RepID=UPI003718752A
MLSDQNIAFKAGLKPFAFAPQGLPYGPFGLVAQVVQAFVEPIDETLLIPEFLG